MQVLPGTRISGCRCPEAGMDLDVGGLVKREGQIGGGEAGRKETRQDCDKVGATVVA